jgi:hypothetical protein
MPTTTPSHARRAAAQEARARRARRIARIRHRAVATAVGTFALALCVVAYDGSMGRPGPASSAASSAVTTTHDPSAPGGSAANDGSAAAGGDVLTTGQS